MGKKFVRVRQPDRNDDAARPVDPEKGRAPRRGANSVAGGSLPQPKMRAVFVVRVDSATPIILNREKSVTPGILGMLALWRSTEL
jgi:hypothetical protein